MRTSSTFFPQRFFGALVSVAGVALIVSSCAKKREAALAETDARTTHTVAEFKALTLKVKTIQLTADVASKIQNLESRDLNSTKTADFVLYSSVDASSVPENLQYMFKKLKVMAPANSVLSVSFDVDSTYLTAYKAADEKLLNPVEKSLLKQSALNSSRIPLFKYKITQFGVLDRERNEFQEQTAKLVMRKTEFEQATHIQISEFTQDRLTVDLSADAKKQIADLRNRSSIDQLVFSGKDLSAVSNLIAAQDGHNYYVKLDGTQMKVSEVINKTTDLANLDQVQSCEGLSVAGLDSSSCGLLPAKVYNLKFFEAALKQEGEEIYGNEISFVEGINSASFIQVTSLEPSADSSSAAPAVTTVPAAPSVAPTTVTPPAAPVETPTTAPGAIPAAPEAPAAKSTTEQPTNQSALIMEKNKI